MQTSLAASVQIALVQTIAVVAAMAMLLGLWNADSGDILTWLLCAFFTLHFAWGFYSWRLLSGRWLDAYSVFFLSLCLFNGGTFLLETFGLNEEGVFGETFSVQTTNRTILLVNAAVTAYHLGGLSLCLRGRFRAQRSQASPEDRRESTCAPDMAKRIGLVFLLVSLPAWIFKITTTVTHAAANGYFSLWQRDVQVGADNWLEVVSEFVLPGILITLAMFHKSRREVALCWGIMCAFTTANFFIGLRSAALVGPRPLLPSFLSRYSARQRRRHLVKPGITGLAQIRGRNSLDWETRFELDVYYTENVCLCWRRPIAWPCG